jgi:hypothetical protein
MAAVRAFSSSLAWGTCRSGRPIGGPVRPRSGTATEFECDKPMASKTTAPRAWPPWCALVGIFQNGHFQSTGPQEDPAARPQFVRVCTPFLYTPSVPPTMRLCILGGTSTGTRSTSSTAGWRSTPSVMAATRLFPDRVPAGPLARSIQARSLREGKDSFQSGSGFATRFRDTLPAGVS